MFTELALGAETDDAERTPDRQRLHKEIQGFFC